MRLNRPLTSTHPTVTSNLTMTMMHTQAGVRSPEDASTCAEKLTAFHKHRNMMINSPPQMVPLSARLLSPTQRASKHMNVPTEAVGKL